MTRAGGLSEHVAAYSKLLDRVVPTFGAHIYRFLSRELYNEILKTDLPKANCIYWSEILYRAHAAASTSLIRSHRWLRAMSDHSGNDNLLGFAAAFRGFVESATDTKASLFNVPATLAHYSASITLCLQNRFTGLLLNGELEDQLIHFLYGRRLIKGEPAPPSHRAKTSSDYLALFEEQTEDSLRACYGVLCELTHPAALSVLSYIDVSEDQCTFRLSPNNDKALIADLLKTYDKVLARLTPLGILPPLFILRIIDTKGWLELECPGVRDIDFDAIPAWQEISATLADSH